MRRHVLLLAAAAVLVPSVAGAVELAPDDRAGIEVDPQPNEDGDGGSVRISGNVGAAPVDNTVRGDASPPGGGDPYLEVTNPPMYDTVGTRGNAGEELYGPPTANAALGVGGLTVGFGDAGVLTNLAWPGPGSYDHVSYANVSRDLPNKGAPENHGAFGGLLLPENEEIQGRRVIWFTPPEGWDTRSQAYGGPDSGTLISELAHPSGLTVTIRDVVDPDDDVLARHFEVQGAPPGSQLVHFANMDPTTSRVPRTPANLSGVTDFAADFATTYDADSGTMLHFRPYTADPSSATVAATGQPGATNTLEALSRTYGTGVYVAVGGDGAPTQFQAGLEAVGLVRGEAEGSPAIDPFYDAADGELSGSPAAFGRTAGALAWEGTNGTVYLAAADEPRAAVDAVTDARNAGFTSIQDAAEADWARWVGQARLPSGSDAQAEAVAKRALMLIRTAQDEDTGAIVANTTAQTPYKQDWLRDGAFFNYALLLAGYDDMVARHNDFYRMAQSAAGHWDPILCTDGAHCSSVFYFEIDAQALGVWALWIEYELSNRTAADLARLRTNYEAIRKGADVLVACQDPTNDMQCYASEDDHPDPTQGAQGASTVFLGLRSAAAAARTLGDVGNATRWDTRAEELRAAARELLCQQTCDKGRGYMIWPGKLLTADAGTPTGLSPVEDHPALLATLDEMAERYPGWMDGITPGAGSFFQYPMEPLFSLATTGWRAADDNEQLLTAAVQWLTHEVAAPGVNHFGERIYHTPTTEDPTSYLHSVGFPHIWSGAETYIAAALIQGLDGCPRGIPSIGDARCARPGRSTGRTPVPRP